jgi:hypothetical protein
LYQPSFSAMQELLALTVTIFTYLLLRPLQANVIA